MGTLREPPPHETHLINELYIDETSQTGHHFLILGGVMFPRSHRDQFEQDIIEARMPNLPAVRASDEPREIAWSEFTSRDLETYKRVVDAFFTFGRRLSTQDINRIRFYCSVVNCQVKGRRYSGKRGELPFNREIYYHCLSASRKNRDSLFHVYPDHRQTIADMEKLRLILNRGIRRDPGETRDWPFRRLHMRLSHNYQALQISDIFIGAVAYKLNGRYDAPNATPERKQLCDYILSRAKAGDCVRNGFPKKKPWGIFQILVRAHRA
jgi:hypothetical protein